MSMMTMMTMSKTPKGLSSFVALLLAAALTGCDSLPALMQERNEEVVYALGPRDGFASPLQTGLKPAHQALEFHKHSFALSSAHQKALLAVAETWKEKKPRYTIAGYTVPGLPDDYARSLSERRAQAVRQKLIESGVEAANLQTVGFGSDASPAGPNTDVVVIYQQP
jgi:outer membrane protein OmpA-like peptidoglycan-associated protein